VVAIVLRRAGMMMAVGLALGGVIAWYASAAVRAFLFETEPNDVATMAAALAVLTAGLLASAVPARRAASVDPLIALRHE
jgi:putative ABC transport system permease protein